MSRDLNDRERYTLELSAQLLTLASRVRRLKGDYSDAFDHEGFDWVEKAGDLLDDALAALGYAAGVNREG